MNLGKEFQKYAISDHNVSSSTLNYYEKHIENSMTPYILEERELRATQMDIFSRLMMDRVLWVAGPVNDGMSTVVQAQLMFLDSVENKDITMHIDSPGGSVKSGLSMVDEARFVKSYDTKVNDAETKKEIKKIYPKAKFFIGKSSHFFGELEPNLFFKAYYAKEIEYDTGEAIKGDFKITSVYSKKGSNYVELMKESLVTEAKKFKPGDMWSSDFDYEGMLKYGLKVNEKTPIKMLNKLFDSATDVNYHTPFRNLGIAIDWIEDGDKAGAKDYIKNFHDDIKTEMKNQGIK